MATQTVPVPLILDEAIEDETRAILISHYSPIYRDRVNDFVGNLLRTDHYVSRFLYLLSNVGPDIFNSEARMLISGFGVGSEMIVARQFGFGKIYGVEVEKILVDACQSRLRYIPDMYPSYYEGDYLPYSDIQFEAVASGHVIEHTRDPELYLRECMRILIPGGYLSLEFPNRYHSPELHTQLPSFEWLPCSIRNVIIRWLSSENSPLKEDSKLRYRSIIDTNLQQISLGDIRRMLNRIGYPFVILNRTKAAPGIIRCVIQKNTSKTG